MKAIIVIPARFGSTRLPGKPLAMIAGKSLLQRTWSIAMAVKQVAGVYIATDDDRIKVHAEGFGAQVIMTPVDVPNGTERAYHAASALPFKPDIILNLQGDAVLTPPWVIQALLDAMLVDDSVGFATTAVRLNAVQYQQMVSSKQSGAVGGTTVVFDHDHKALYFSKALIPFMREKPDVLPVFRHIGLYVYRYEVLKKYLALPPTVLEQVEGLEQLRALVHGIPIKVVEVDYRGRSHCAVDSQADVDYVEQIIAAEGELLPAGDS